MKIYVLTHKPCNIPPGDIYVPLQVGSAISQNLGYLSDNTGENISNLNPLFGELTGIYWIWQNDLESDYIGICHYRRFYLNDTGEIMTEQDFTSILSQYDCMTSDLQSAGMGNYEAYGKTHPIQDLDIIKSSLNKLYPDYIPAFEAYMNDSSSCYSNLCVMPRDMFSAYCSWLFSILFNASESINVEGYDLYQRRVYGFLSELLLDVYVRHHSFNVYRTPVGTFGDKAETNELFFAVNSLIRESKYKEARNLCQEIINIRPDIMLPMSDGKQRVPIIDHLTCILDLEDESHIRGFSGVSGDLGELIEYYRNVHQALSEGVSPDNIRLLKENRFSPYAALVMVSNDIARAIHMPPIDTKKAENLLKEVFSARDFELYKGFISKFSSPSSS